MTFSGEKLSLSEKQEEEHGEDWFGKDMLKDGDWENKFRPNLLEHNYQEIQELHQEYLEKYLQEQEAVEAFFNALPALSAQKQLKGPRLKGEKRREKIKELTEYQFLLTHFLINNNEKEEKTKEFWFLLENMASASKKTIELKTMKQGILGQVAIFLALKQLGFNPHLAHPDLDMFEQIDLQVPESKSRKEIDVQVKSSRQTSYLQFFPSQKIYSSSVEISQSEEKKVDLTSQYFAEKSKAFNINLEDYQKENNITTEGFLVVVPTSEMDPFTGCPSDKLVDFLKEKLEIT